MASPFPFESMIVFGWLACMLIVGVVLRARISFLQRFLFPSCLIGGVIGLILIHTPLINIAVFDLETFAYHFFNISFISVGLTYDQGDNATSRSKGYIKGPAWMALVQGSCFGLQAALSGLLVIIFGILGLKLFPTFGFLVPLGFEEGPGQALSVGKVWEGFGFAQAATLGLTFAAIGYFFAFFVGVPLVNWGIRKGLAAHGTQDMSRDVLTGIISKERRAPSAGRLALHTGNIDPMAFQAALVGLAYLVTYVFIKYVGLLLLRIADPEFKTPVAIEIAVMNALSIIPIGGCLLLVNAPVWWNWGVGTTSMVFLGVMAATLALIRLLKMWGPPKF